MLFEKNFVLKFELYVILEREFIKYQVYCKNNVCKWLIKVLVFNVVWKYEIKILLGYTYRINSRGEIKFQKFDDINLQKLLLEIFIY